MGFFVAPFCPSHWVDKVTVAPTPTQLGGQSYVQLSTQWGGHVTAHCPPSGMDGESNGENVGENVIHSWLGSSPRPDALRAPP
jgi:hypothetical protein